MYLKQYERKVQEKNVINVIYGAKCAVRVWLHVMLRGCTNYRILLLPGSDCSRVSDVDGNLHLCVPVAERDLLPGLPHLLPHTGQS